MQPGAVALQTAIALWLDFAHALGHHHCHTKGCPMMTSLHKNRIVASITVLASSLLLNACGDKGAELSASNSLSGGSCHVVATGNCMEYTGAAWKGMTMQRLCESQKGVYAAGACPSEGKLGSCLKSKGTKDENRLNYYTSFPGYGVKLTPDAVVKEGQEQCTKTIKGEWRAK